MIFGIFLVSLLCLYCFYRPKRKTLFLYLLVFGLFAAIPLGGNLVKIFFQDYYGGEQTMWILPIYGVIAFCVACLMESRKDRKYRIAMMLIVCMIIILCGRISKYQADAPKVDVQELSQVYDLLLEGVSEEDQILLIGPDEIVTGARAYSDQILLVYGRDMLEGELNPYFYDGYDPMLYKLREHLKAPIEENERLVLEELKNSYATHVVFDKAYLTFDADGRYPDEFRLDGYRLGYMGETYRYVIYERTSS